MIRCFTCEQNQIILCQPHTAIIEEVFHACSNANSQRSVKSTCLNYDDSDHDVKSGLALDLLNVLRPPFCTLATHSWINWVDEDDWWGWLERKARRKYYIDKRPEALDSQFCHYYELRTRESACASRLKAPSGGGGGWNPGQVAPASRSLILVPPSLKEVVFKVVEPKLVDRLSLP